MALIGEHRLVDLESLIRQMPFGDFSMIDVVITLSTAGGTFGMKPGS